MTSIGFHPVRGCVERLQWKQKQIDTDFADLRSRFAQGFPASGPVPALSPAYLSGLLEAIIEEAPKELRDFKKQLADCLQWELNRNGEHVCAGYQVSEETIRALYTEINQEVTCGPQTSFANPPAAAHFHSVHE